MQLLFSTNFLEEILTQEYYREYLELNFDEKIFFHEPVNKYFDLLWVRKLAWTSLQRFKAIRNPLKMNRNRIEANETEINRVLDAIFTEGTQARLISIKIEKLSTLVLQASMNTMSDGLRNRIANHPFLDRYVRVLVGQN